MSDPTIDEMLEWVDEAAVVTGPRDDKYRKAIQTILEEYRLMRDQGYAMVPDAAIEQTKLEAIRAFVERAEARLPGYSSGRGADEWLKNYHRAIKDELDVLEQQWNAGSASDVTK